MNAANLNLHGKFVGHSVLFVYLGTAGIGTDTANTSVKAKCSHVLLIQFVAVSCLFHFLAGKGKRLEFKAVLVHDNQTVAVCISDGCPFGFVMVSVFLRANIVVIKVINL